MRADQVCALFISDLHLQPAHAATSEAFFDFLERHARHAQQLYLLGDLFEYWAGDDDIGDPLYHQQIIAALRARQRCRCGRSIGSRATAISWSAPAVRCRSRQRDRCCRKPGWHRDRWPARRAAARRRAVYAKISSIMEFRAMVRQHAWQQQFTAMPLAQRKAIIAGLRAEQPQGTRRQILRDHGRDAASHPRRVCRHRRRRDDPRPHAPPALHHVDGKRRYVLPDWEPEATPPRGGWIAIDGQGAVTRHDLGGAIIPA